MKERKLSKALWLYITFFIVTMIQFFLVPIPEEHVPLSKGDVWWPFTMMSDGELVKLSLARGWIIDFLPLFFGILFVMEFFYILGVLKIAKNKIVKIVAGMLFFILFLSLLYFIIYSLENLWPAWPMNLEVWSVIFGHNKFLWVWWALPAVSLHVALKS